MRYATLVHLHAILWQLNSYVFIIIDHNLCIRTLVDEVKTCINVFSMKWRFLVNS